MTPTTIPTREAVQATMPALVDLMNEYRELETRAAQANGAARKAHEHATQTEFSYEAGLRHAIRANKKPPTNTPLDKAVKAANVADQVAHAGYEALLDASIEIATAVKADAHQISLRAFRLAEKRLSNIADLKAQMRREIDALARAVAIASWTDLVPGNVNINLDTTLLHPLADLDRTLTVATERVELQIATEIAAVEPAPEPEPAPELTLEDTDAAVGAA